MTTKRKTTSKPNTVKNSTANVAQRPADHVMEVRVPKPEPEPAPKFRLKIFGVGGAGCNAIDHIAAVRAAGDNALAGVDLVAVGTSLQALQGVAGAEKIQIGSMVTHGLGAGGDTELGARAAQQDAERLSASVQNTDVVFIVTCLGGGTGGGASPVLARLAREQGALVLAFAAMPFTFEGERRRQQALASLEQLKSQAGAVICVPNDKLSKLVGDNGSVVDAFRRGNEIMATGAQAIWQLLSRKGLINLDFANLRGLLGAGHGVGAFGFGEGRGADKVRDAVKSLTEFPLLDGGDGLTRADGVLVSILGGPELSLADVQKAVEPISRLAARAHVVMGAAIDESYRGRLVVTVIAAAQQVHKKTVDVTRAKSPLAPRPADHGAFRSTALPPSTVAASTVQAAGQSKLETHKAKQETLPLEGVSRGRFEKTEPTLYDGEDLDVPTFIRRGVSLKR